MNRINERHSPETKRPVRVAIVGLGNNGLEHLRAFAALSTSDAQIVGFVTRNSEKSMERSGIKNRSLFFTNFKDLYEVANPDLVIISVPIQNTLEVIMEAKEFPWDILIEKPLGKNLSEARTIFEICERNPLGRYYLGLNRRFYPTSLTISELIKEELSSEETRLIVSVRDRQSRSEAKIQGFDSEVIENWQFANSIHGFDLGISYLGIHRDSNLQVTSDIYDPSFLVKGTVHSQELGMLTYESIWANQGYWGISVHSKNWWISQMPLESITCSKNLEQNVKEKILKYSEQSGIKPGFLNQAKALVGLNVPLTSKLVPLNEGLFTMQLIDRVFHG